MFGHLLESSRDDSNKWSNIGFGQETKELRSIEINFTQLIWSSALPVTFYNSVRECNLTLPILS